jgi:hypothetical protein
MGIATAKLGVMQPLPLVPEGSVMVADGVAIAEDSTGAGAVFVRAGGRYRLVAGLALVGAFTLMLPDSAAFAYPNPSPVPLGTAGTFTVLGGSTVTNIGYTVISADTGVGGNLGLSPGSSVTGFPPGVVTPPGVQDVGDAAAGSAQTDAGNALTVAQGLTPNQTFPPVYDLVSQTFTAGVYNDPSSLALSGTVTLDGGGNPDSVFVFQAGSTLVTSASSIVALTNGAQACNVFWVVGSSATLGATSVFNGTILASASATIGDGTQIQGRVLAGTGAVTLSDDVIHTPACAPSSGVSQDPLFGSLAGWVTAAAFVGGAGVLVFRRRLQPILDR